MGGRHVILGLMKRRDVKIQVQRVQDPKAEFKERRLTPAEGIALVWDLTVDAWAFKGERIAESGLPRHIVHIQRRTR